MNWYTMFYLFSILDKLYLFFQWGAGLCTLFFVGLTITRIYFRSVVNVRDEENDGFKEGVRWLKILRWPYVSVITFGIIFWLALVFTPTRKDMIIIIAGGAVGEFIMNDDNAKQLPADITRFLRGEILKATAELTDDAKVTLGIETEAQKLKKLSREELEKMLLDKIDKKTP